MKSLFSGLFLFALGSMLLTSCVEQEKKSTNNDKVKAESDSSMQITDSYQPGKEYKLSWADEFEGDSLNMDNWNYQVEEAGRFNGEWQRYTNSSKNAFVENGNLVIKAIHEGEEHGMDQYTSARMNTANKQSWKYGKIVARIKLPEGKGIWPAFWMLGANIDENGGDTPWPQCGEIDILELYGSKDDGTVEANVHYADESDKHASMGAVAFKLKEGKFADNFHIFELEWDENHLAWSVDGEQYVSTKISDPEFSEFDEKFFILLNVAVGNKYVARPDDTSPFPQFMYVDWVRVYQK